MVFTLKWLYRRSLLFKFECICRTWSWAEWTTRVKNRILHPALCMRNRSMRRMNNTRPKTGFMSRSVRNQTMRRMKNHVAKNRFFTSWSAQFEPESIATLSPFGPIEGQKWFPRFPANESLRRTGLHLSLSAKSSFYHPAFKISRSWCTASLEVNKTSKGKSRFLYPRCVQVEPEHAQKGAAGVQVPVDVLAHHLPRVLEHLRPRHWASQPAALARRVSGQVTVQIRWFVRLRNKKYYHITYILRLWNLLKFGGKIRQINHANSLRNFRLQKIRQIRFSQFVAVCSLVVYSCNLFRFSVLTN